MLVTAVTQPGAVEGVAEDVTQYQLCLRHSAMEQENDKKAAVEAQNAANAAAAAQAEQALQQNPAPSGQVTTVVSNNSASDTTPTINAANTTAI